MKRLKTIKNNYGMTLVEIVVVLAISSIIMVIVGGVILTSTGFFQRTTVASQDKEGLDDIANFVRKELLYATDVYIDSSAPDDTNSWDCIYVDGGRLYYNGDLLLDEEFYGKRALVIKITSIAEYRLDFLFEYKDRNSELIYSTRTSLELSNIQLRSNSNDPNIIFPNLITSAIINNGDNKIYYRKNSDKPIVKNRGGDDEPIITEYVKGTVGEQIIYLNTSNYFGGYATTLVYPKGSIVYYNGAYYLKLVDGNQSSGQDITTDSGWKRLTAQWAKGSGYEEGDIVIHNGIYYQCQKDMINSNTVPEPGSNDSQADKIWKEVTAEYVSNHDIGENTFVYNNITTPSKVLSSIGNLITVPVYDSTKIYSNGDIVKVQISGFTIASNTVNAIYGYTYYMLCDDTLSGTPGVRGVNNENGWMTLTASYDSNSYYRMSDIIVFTEQGTTLKANYYQALTNIAAATGNDEIDIIKSSFWSKSGNVN